MLIILSFVYIECPTIFPYLEAPDLSDEQRKKWKKQLKKETNKMMDRFAILISKTLSSLGIHHVSIGELKALLINLSGHKKNKLTRKLKKVTVIRDTFDVLCDFWSFFNYKILGDIITSFCFDLKPDFDEYVLKFKEYCKCRVCEVPDDSYSTKLSKSKEKKLHIQIDQNFVDEIVKLKMKDLKDLSDILEDVLNTHLRILKIKDGSIILTFHCLHDLDVLFPLSSKQEEKLHEIGVTRIFTREQEYYRYSPPPKGIAG